jgi:hypothetical protein
MKKRNESPDFPQSETKKKLVKQIEIVIIFRKSKPIEREKTKESDHRKLTKKTNK